MKTNKSTRAKSAQTETAKRVSNRRRAAKETRAAVVDVETIETQTEDTTAAGCLAVVTETKSGKVTSNEVLRAAGNLRAAVKEERRGANCTIRLIAERAASGDAAAVDVLCALCDVPRAALYSLNIDTIRASVNAYYPYYIEDNNRKVSVKAVGVWYSTKNNGDLLEDAARVKRGYMVKPVIDYLDQLIKAAKSRAKGVTPRRVDADTIYSDNKLSTASDGITATEIEEAKARRAYSDTAANVWKRDRNGYYI